MNKKKKLLFHKSQPRQSRSHGLCSPIISAECILLSVSSQIRGLQIKPMYIGNYRLYMKTMFVFNNNIKTACIILIFLTWLSNTLKYYRSFIKMGHLTRQFKILCPKGQSMIQLKTVGGIFFKSGCGFNVSQILSLYS